MCACVCAHDDVSIVALIIHCCSTFKCAWTLRWLFNQAKDLHGLQHMWHTKDVILRRFIGSNWVMSSSWIIKTLFRSGLDLHILPHITHTYFQKIIYDQSSYINIYFTLRYWCNRKYLKFTFCDGSMIKTLKGMLKFISNRWFSLGRT